MKGIISIFLNDLLSRLSVSTLAAALESLQETEFDTNKNTYIETQIEDNKKSGLPFTNKEEKILRRITFTNIRDEMTLKDVSKQLPKQIKYLIRKANKIKNESHIQIILSEKDQRDDYKKIAEQLSAASLVISRYRLIFSQNNHKGDKNPIDQLMHELYLQVVKSEIPSINIDKPGPLLLCGHTGSGKSLTAQLLTSNYEPSLTLNMAALTDTLLESRIRGFKKHSFTGAKEDKKSIFEEAHDGVIFFDELQSASIEAQTQLLDLINSVSNKVRVAQIGKEEEPVDFNVKTIFAINEDISKLIDENRLRKDLFFRMRQVVKFRSLSERLNDITKGAELLELLIAIHRWKYAIELNPEFSLASQTVSEDIQYNYYKILKIKFTKEAIAALREHSWPGNLRELERVMADIFWDVKNKHTDEVNESIVKMALNSFNSINTSQDNKHDDTSDKTKDDLTDDERYIIRSIEEKLSASNFSVDAILPSLKVFGMTSRPSFRSFIGKYQHYFDKSVIDRLSKNRFKIPAPEDIHTQS